MASPTTRLAFDLEIVRQAAANWRKLQRSRGQKERALAAGRYDQAETRERLAKRLNRVKQTLQAVVPAAATEALRAGEDLATALPPEVQELMARGPVQPADIDNRFVERVIGATRDFLSVGFFDRGRTASRAVCRIVTELGGGNRGLGTGFMASPALLMTNEHVLKSAEAAARSFAEFDFQLDPTGSVLPVQRFDLRPDLFFLNDRKLDFALVAIAPASRRGRSIREYGFCPLIGVEGKIILGDPVNVVQHPRGEMKQVVIRENKLLDLPRQIDHVAHYTADTEPGSSGSPVFNDEWEVIALHHSGVPRTDASGNILDVDGRRWQRNDDPARIDWIANEGIRTSRLVAFIRSAQVRAHEAGLRDEFLALTETTPDRRVEGAGAAPVPIAAAPHPAAPPAAASPVHAQGSAQVTIPLTITIGVGTAAAAQAVPRDDFGAVDTAAAEAIRPDPDYSNRPGFDARFLGFDAPLPKLSAAIRQLAVPVGSGFELKYFHYSVIMNQATGLAFVSAVNLDGGAPFFMEREGSDRWFYDPRIARERQIGNELYANNPLDRGHLTRRADAGWGHTEEEARLANDDTFHWTNCAPQHEVFNQSTRANRRGLLLWGNLENHVAEQAGSDRLSVFNGPVFRDNDRIHRGVRIPKEYWKVIAYKRANGRPGAVAFVLSQASLIRNLPAEEFQVGPYRPFQVQLSQLEGRTKLDFGAIAGLDPLASEAPETFLEGAEGSTFARPLERLRDVAV